MGMAIPCGIIAAGVSNEANNYACGLESSHFCLHGWTSVFAMIVAFSIHLVVHLLFLTRFFTSARFGLRHVPAKSTYEEVVPSFPCTWFTANPVHCLRSRYIYHDASSNYCSAR